MQQQRADSVPQKKKKPRSVAVSEADSIPNDSSNESEAIPAQINQSVSRQSYGGRHRSSMPPHGVERQRKFSTSSKKQSLTGITGESQTWKGLPRSTDSNRAAKTSIPDSDTEQQGRVSKERQMSGPQAFQKTMNPQPHVDRLGVHETAQLTSITDLSQELDEDEDSEEALEEESDIPALPIKPGSSTSKHPDFVILDEPKKTSLPDSTQSTSSSRPASLHDSADSSSPATENLNPWRRNIAVGNDGSESSAKDVRESTVSEGGRPMRHGARDSQSVSPGMQSDHAENIKFAQNSASEYDGSTAYRSRRVSDPEASRSMRLGGQVRDSVSERMDGETVPQSRLNDATESSQSQIGQMFPQLVYVPTLFAFSDWSKEELQDIIILLHQYHNIIITLECCYKKGNRDHSLLVVHIQNSTPTQDFWHKVTQRTLSAGSRLLSKEEITIFSMHEEKSWKEALNIRLHDPIYLYVPMLWIYVQCRSARTWDQGLTNLSIDRMRRMTLLVSCLFLSKQKHTRVRRYLSSPLESGALIQIQVGQARLNCLHFPE